MSAVHWVNARTKTKSKNSSSGRTDPSWRSSALSFGTRLDSPSGWVICCFEGLATPREPTGEQ